MLPDLSAFLVSPELSVLEPVHPWPESAPGMAYTRFQPAEVLHVDDRTHKILSTCIDSGSPVSLIDRRVLRDWFPDTEIRKMSAGSLRLGGVSAGRMESQEFVVLNIQYKTTSGTFIRFTGEFHISSNDLHCNILVANDILYRYGVQIDVGR